MKFNQAKIRKTSNYLIRALIIVATYGFIYRQIFHHRRLDDLIRAFQEMVSLKNAGWVLSLAVLLMILNWGLESAKWRVLIEKFEKISLLKAYKAVLTGVSVSLFTPNRTGDYLGRVFILDKANHIEGILATIIGSFAQIVVTLSLGLFAFLGFADRYIRIAPQLQGYFISTLVFLIPIAVFLLLLLYFRIGLLTGLIRRILPGKWQKFSVYVEVFSRYNNNELILVLMLGFFRYLIYSLQFMLLLHVFGVQLPFLESLLLIPVIYLVMTLVPSVALVDLGIRGSVSVYLIGLYFNTFQSGVAHPELAILTASAALWFINLIFPAILGTFFVFQLKFFRK
jgi:hypothetical protein